MADNSLDDKKRAFASKWSLAIEKHGYTNVPNLLLYQLQELEINAPEFLTLIALISFKWSDSKPWPSVESISKRTDCLPRTVRVHLASLDKKGILLRQFRIGFTTEYSIEPLIKKLDLIAISALPHGAKDPPSLDETYEGARMKSTAEENSTNQNSAINPIFNKKSVKPLTVWEIARQKYGRPP